MEPLPLGTGRAGLMEPLSPRDGPSRAGPAPGGAAEGRAPGRPGMQRVPCSGRAALAGSPARQARLAAAWACSSRRKTLVWRAEESSAQSSESPGSAGESGVTARPSRPRSPQGSLSIASGEHLSPAVPASSAVCTSPPSAGPGVHRDSRAG